MNESSALNPKGEVGDQTLEVRQSGTRERVVLRPFRKVKSIIGTRRGRLSFNFEIRARQHVIGAGLEFLDSHLFEEPLVLDLLRGNDFKAF